MSNIRGYVTDYVIFESVNKLCQGIIIVLRHGLNYYDTRRI